jgi:phospholysine phosphohistidine inorganic pyrophosphate phosphatase
MGPRRPPDILRKSHAHTDRKPRARDKAELRDALDESATADGLRRGLLIDLDGVIYRGDEPIAGSADAVRWLHDEGIPHLFVTNTTSRPREALVDKLAGFGVDLSIDDILAPPDAAAAWLKAQHCERVLLAVPKATAGVFSEFDTQFLDQATAKAESAPVEGAGRFDAVVVGDIGSEWTFERLNAAFRCLMEKPTPRLIALGMTRYWHAPDGLRLDTAPFVVALAHASGVEPTVLGKPARAFFDAALQRLGTGAGDTWMIGDDIKTDVGGAQAAGLKGILVKTGKYRESDLELGITPDLVIDSLAVLPDVWA